MKFLFSKTILILTTLAVIYACSDNNNSTPIYKNPDATIEQRVDDLLDKMTLEEKIAQLYQLSVDDLKEENFVAVGSFSKEKNIHGIGALAGLKLSVDEFVVKVNDIQKYLTEETRLGIPAIFLAESLHGLAQDGSTIFPQAIGMGSTWNPELIREVGNAMHQEIKATGASQVLTPVLDVVRDLRWGRVEETYGEDPYLVSQIGKNMIDGFQKGATDGEPTLIATAKHFLTYSNPHGGLNLASSPGGWYDLYNTHMPPFKEAIESGVLCVMTAYHSYDGKALTGSKEIYTNLLREQLGFEGYVYSDWGSIGMLHTFHKVANSYAAAGKMAIEAGVDLEASSPETYKHLDSLVTNNIIDIEVIDKAVKRVLKAKFQVGLFENPYVDPARLKTDIHTPEHIKLAKKVADESIILLKNENNILPLDGSKLKSIALIGPNANQVQFGDYTWSNDNKDGINLMEGVEMVAPNLKINYAKGCDMVSLDKSQIANAVKAAKNSDVAVVAIGTKSAVLSRDYSDCTSGEGFDLSNLDPTGVQQDLVKAIVATGTPTIVVLVQGRPFSMPWIKENVPAIIEAWYPGEQGGLSLAEILFGKLNPSGKLTVSFPQSVGHLPCYYNHLPTDKGFYKKPGIYGKPGKDYVFSSPKALYPFGYGLSYTKFSYNNIGLSHNELSFNDELTVNVEVSNSGDMDGKEVVQLYIRQDYTSIARPVKELKAFKKVAIKAGETKQVALTLKMNDCGYYNNKGEYLTESGNIKIMVGSSSDNIHFTKVIKVN